MSPTQTQMTREYFRIPLSALLATWLLTGCLVLMGCDEDQPTEELPDTVLQIAIDPNYPPFEFVDPASGKVVGFDIDLILEVCDRNGWIPDFIEMPFAELLAAVATRSVDAAVSAVSITPQREALVAFSDPYYLSQLAVCVLAEDTTIGGIGDLRGKRIGVLSGTTSEALAKAGRGVLVFPFSSIEQAFNALRRGEIEAVINDYATSATLVRDSTQVRLIMCVDDLEFYGIAVNRADSARLETINYTLAEMMGDGTIDSIHQRWFSRPMFEPRSHSSDSLSPQ
ncbi:transporter substrate-binding domain-containing protein [candidate division GN15 bacterium]|nr:transporter substrate-binding domain-containing protein [candidate division GN15 bacterium]